MAAIMNGHANGHSDSLYGTKPKANTRFSDIPSAIDIPVSGGLDVDEADVELNLEELLDDSTELCTLLENENASKNLWMVISLAYAKQNKVDHAIEILNRGLASLSRGGPKEKLGLLSCLCWLYLWKCREAPRVVPTGQLVSEARTKDFYLQAATGSLNEASRVNPSFPPLFLARGVLSLLRASLQPPLKPMAAGMLEQSERVETLRQALKCFEDALRVSAGRNMMAVLGKARALFSLERYADALECYQEVLSKMPDLQDPDPRIGIGCCLWQLKHREEARDAWERAVEINPDSKIANVLLGLYYVDSSSRMPPSDPAFAPTYQKAMTQYIQKAFKIDKSLPLACATFGGYFLPRKAWPTVDSLARKAIERTDVNAIASDGWYLLARKEHYQDPPNLARATDYYNRADIARGGGHAGYIPARFGNAQIQVLNGDYDGAKFRLEKMIADSRGDSKPLEAMMLLGTLYAQDVFNNQSANVKEDKLNELKKAIALLEAVRLAWKDPKKNIKPVGSILVTLARLYETEQPEKSLQCLLQVEQMTLDEIPDSEKPDDIEDEDLLIAKLKEQLPPQLLNNIGCFQFQSEKYDQAREMFQIALTACVKIGEKDETVDSDALVTTISYNLARTYEAHGMLEEAKQVYEGLLARHDDYTDARTRLAYIEFRQNPTSEGPKAMVALYESDPTNLEVRALYGWFLSRAKRRAMNIAEDQEQRHYKHTLQHYDKHDRYSLTGMGNLYLTTAREMRRDTEQDKDRKRKTYEKAVEFYDKALQLDPKNAYAAQGIGIALAEDKKDFPAVVQVFSKVRDTVRDPSIYVNLGHVYGELKQFSRAIENYEAALSKDRANDPQILACLGRIWLLKGKQEKSVVAMKISLDYSYKALQIAPEQIHFKFNIAFVQIQLAQLIYSLPENQRTLQEVEAAAEGLDEAIESFGEIAHSKNPPYPKHDIEQRANMGKNTMRRQLERAVQQQRDYEAKNAAKMDEARKTREEEIRTQEEVKRKAEEHAAGEKKRLAEERHKLLEVSRELAERRAEEERRKEEAEYTEDEETGERVKRKKKKISSGKRKTKGDEGDGEDGSGAEAAPRKARAKSTVANSAAGSSDRERAPKKRRKLARKSEIKANSKFKSSEMIVDSDEDANMDDAGRPTNTDGSAPRQSTEEADGDTRMLDADEESDEDEDAVQVRRKKFSRRIDDDDDQDEGEDQGVGGVTPQADGGEEDDDDAATMNGTRKDHADSLVDESTAAAGDADTAEY